MQDILSGIAAFINRLGQMAIPVLSLAGLFLALIVLFLSLLILWRIIKLSRSSILIIEPINNATEDDALDKALPGLTQLAREKLVEKLEVVRARLIEYKELGPENYQLPPDLITLSGAAENKVSDLLKSLSDMTSGKLKTVIQLFNLIFVPKATRITITLQPCLKSKTIPQCHSGISLEVKDLRGRQKPALYTIWGPDASLEDISSLEQYYIDVLDPAMYSLALELFQLVIGRTRPRSHSKAEFQAQLFNYIGEFYLSAGGKYKEYPFFYKKALWEFNQAAAADRSKSWHHPYENIGETYKAMGQTGKAKGETEETGLREDMRKAISNFNKALDILLSQEFETEQELTRKQHDERKIRINMANAYMITPDFTSISKAKQEISLAKLGWNLDAETDSRILYNLACWYAKIDRLPIRDTAIPDARQSALRYIAYSLVRDCNQVNHGDLIDWVLEDPELEDMRNELKKLIPLLQEKIHRNPDFPNWNGSYFVQALQHVLLTSGTCNPIIVAQRAKV